MIEKFFNKLLGKRPTKVLSEDIGNFSLLKEDNMKTIKIIDLLNKIVNGEEIPKYVEYYDKLHQKKDTMMCYYNNIIYKLDNNIIDLLDEVEILEEEQIPKKLDKRDFLGNQTFEQVDADLDFIINKINEILDYLKSKGE